uniref:Uncharacterized protein n=1 Tax=Lotus japonicus TaxID=34305 RepID=I3SGJ6_LOTJA|nr:unknown [Lotus japonicus]
MPYPNLITKLVVSHLRSARGGVGQFVVQSPCSTLPIITGRDKDRMYRTQFLSLPLPHQQLVRPPTQFLSSQAHTLSNSNPYSFSAIDDLCVRVACRYSPSVHTSRY